MGCCYSKNIDFPIDDTRVKSPMSHSRAAQDGPLDRQFSHPWNCMMIDRRTICSLLCTICFLLCTICCLVGIPTRQHFGLPSPLIAQRYVRQTERHDLELVLSPLCNESGLLPIFLLHLDQPVSAGRIEDTEVSSAPSVFRLSSIWGNRYFSTFVA